MSVMSSRGGMVSPSDWRAIERVAVVYCESRRKISIRVGQDHRWHIEDADGGEGIICATPRAIGVRVYRAAAQIEVTLECERRSRVTRRRRAPATRT